MTTLYKGNNKITEHRKSRSWLETGI